MEGRGLVQRTECVEDGRGAFVGITPAGRAAIEHAAPGHVSAVRRLMFDALSDDEVACLARTIDKLLDQQH
jgi:DNA-binding MarR family transcriptional regulator